MCRTDFIEVPKKGGMLADVQVHEVHSGHWSTYEKPDEVGKIVVEWLKKKGFVES